MSVREMCSCLSPPLAPTVDVHTIVASASTSAPFQAGVPCVVFGYTGGPPAPSTLLDVLVPPGPTISYCIYPRGDRLPCTVWTEQGLQF